MNNIISSRRIPVANAAKVWLRTFGAALLLLCFEVRPAHAVMITLGDRIELTPTTFALPIQIVDAIELSEWFLDLTYDPTDVQVNVGCDPFSGDVYCSLLTGPVTEGDFFAAGAPFNLLIPGFVELDPITLAQTGRLFGMHGAFGGSLPAPSGNGILAYIQFTLLGTGDSPIVPGGPLVPDPTSVPEPGTMALLATALAFGLLARRRRAAVVTCAAMASLSVVESSSAQAFPPAIELPSTIPVVMLAPVGGYPATVAPTAAGPYVAPSAWSQTLAPNMRFVILSNLNSDAVLDRETGLVWARRTSEEDAFSYTAAGVCRRLIVGNRMGWRMPTIAELQSLIDPSQTATNTVPRLPAGHPFVLSSPFAQLPHWTAETLVGDGDSPDHEYRYYVSLSSGFASAMRTSSTTQFSVLCVRGSDASRTSDAF